MQHIVQNWSVGVAGVITFIVVWATSQFCGTWLVWLSPREWFRGYWAENLGRDREDIPKHYGWMKRKVWLAGWDCSAEVTPYGD